MLDDDTIARFDFGGRSTNTLHDEILRGLDAPQKTLPSKLFYDEAGCALFNRITHLPEYYVTRAERALLDIHAADIAARIPAQAALVEYGAADESKSLPLLDAAALISAYVPIDIAPSALDAITARMRATHPGLPVVPVVADFLQPLDLSEEIGASRCFGFFPGSTIGNFKPGVAIRFLRQVRDTLAASLTPPQDARFVVGIDLRKDAKILVPAYDDSQGVTAAFNRNILSHVNTVASATFEPDSFAHEARWNDAEGRIEMHLRSLADQSVRVADRIIHFQAGETIHTENSYKHTSEGFAALAAQAGWQTEEFWTDPDGQFGMFFLSH